MANLSEEERAAQRVIVGMFRSVNHVLGPTRAALWTEDEYKDPEEVAGLLAVLGVPAEVFPTFKPPRAKSFRNRWGHEAVIGPDGIEVLCARWMPSLGERLAALPAGTPDPREFVVVQFDEDTVLLGTLKWSLDWPAWSLAQMQRARLLCSQCERDPRDPQVGCYQIAERPGRFQRYCGRCAEERRPGMVLAEHLGEG